MKLAATKSSTDNTPQVTSATHPVLKTELSEENTTVNAPLAGFVAVNESPTDNKLEDTEGTAPLTLSSPHNVAAKTGEEVSDPS